MYRVVLTHSETETQSLAAGLAGQLFARRPVFVQLEGGLGAGKTAFARGFIARWCELAKDPVPETIVSPTYNIAKVYGTRAPLAHLDLYRVKSLAELEALGFEHYFFEQACCLVEWLEQIPEALALKPEKSIHITFGFVAASPNAREIKIEE